MMEDGNERMWDDGDGDGEVMGVMRELSHK